MAKGIEQREFKRQGVLHFKIERAFLKINCLLGLVRTGCIKDSIFVLMK